MKTPSDIYYKSNIKYNEFFDYKYPFGFQIRKIGGNGAVKIKNTEYFISQSLSGLFVALEEKNETEYLLWLNNYPIGILDLKLACLKLESEIK